MKNTAWSQSATCGVPPDEAQLVWFYPEATCHLTLLPSNHGPLSSSSNLIGFALTDGEVFDLANCPVMCSTGLSSKLNLKCAFARSRVWLMIRRCFLFLGKCSSDSVDLLAKLTEPNYSADTVDVAPRHYGPQASIRTRGWWGGRTRSLWQLLLTLIRCVVGFCLFMVWMEKQGQAVTPARKWTSFISNWEQTAACFPNVSTEKMSVTFKHILQDEYWLSAPDNNTFIFSTKGAICKVWP